MSPPLKVVVDQDMPCVDKLFSTVAEVIKVSGREIAPIDVKNADALLCRSVTPVNQSLLKGSSVKFVGTATIGIDHLDTPWLNSKGIVWQNAAGCNADAVAQYVLSAIAFWCNKFERDIHQLRVGIVGAGHVGSALVGCLEKLGIAYLLCDPPLAEQGDPRSFSSFEQVFQADVVTLHVPLTKTSDLGFKKAHNTYHLIDKKRLGQLVDSQLLINASRGAVVNNQALAVYLKQQDHAQVVLDVYENEPAIDPDIVKNCLLSTPHIAGHSLEGKVRGTWLIYKAFCEHFGLKVALEQNSLYPQANQANFSAKNMSLEQMLLHIYPIELDSKALKQVDHHQVSSSFDQARKNATQLANGMTRRDYSGWQFSEDSDFPL
ncbi:MAG: 4-phosphoerythronate dehydrogenase [Enterobacterales bacterium]|nr:4-phosphoerythronate dehydrogenase [Enterobacterales bacterium]